MQHIFIFTIFDVKAHAYLQPFHMPTLGEATRLFSDCINDTKHPFGKHPEDYILFTAGHFNLENGKHELLDALKLVGQGIDFLTEKEPYIELEQNIHVPTISSMDIK